jgi:hypothetical protein
VNEKEVLEMGESLACVARNQIEAPLFEAMQLFIINYASISA